MLPGDQPELEALRGEGERGAHRYRVQPVGVAVKVELDHRVRVEDSEVGSAAGDGFVLGPVDKHLHARVGPAQRDKVPDPVGAGHGAAHPAAVEAGVEEAPEDGLTEVRGLAVAAEAEVVSRQEIVVVHDGDQVGRADHGHLVLLGVEGDDFARMQLGDRLQPLAVGWAVGVDGDSGVPAGDQRPQPLVGEDRPDPAATGLLVAGAPALGVVPAEIQAAEEGVLRPGTGRDHRNVAGFALGEMVGQDGGEGVGVFGQPHRGVDLHRLFDPVHVDDDIGLRLALDLHGVEA
jgi:hypothetical protein